MCVSFTIPMEYVKVSAVFVAVLVAVTTVILTYFKRAFKYWEKRNLPGLEPAIPFGTMESPFARKNAIGVSVKNLYVKLKSQGFKHAGTYVFAVPEYTPIHPEFIKNVLQRDFQHFTDRGFYYNEKDEPLGVNLFAIGGQKWKTLRAKLTPTFSSGKVKTMFETLIQCGHQMLEALNSYQNREAMDIKEILACYTTDVIGSCAFGLECNSFKSPEAEFRKHGKKIFEPISTIQNIRFALMIFKPHLAKALGVRIFPKETTDFFMRVVKETVKFREANGVERKDMLKLLIDLKNSEDGHGLTIEEIAAQAFVFFFAGFETSSTTMTFFLYEMAKHSDLQNKVRDEVNRVLEKHDGKISYDSIMDMKYMNQVIYETLRKYPPLPFITRQCVKDYNVPNTNVTIPKGINAVISILGLHHDPEHYPDPEKFDPERFSENNKQQRHPFAFIPFGEGPRNCIGLRFGMMQTKVGLALLLKHYKFSLSQKTVDPFVMDRYSLILKSETGIFLDAEKVQQ